MILDEETQKALRLSQAMLPPMDLEGFEERYALVARGGRVADLYAPPQYQLMEWNDFVKLTARAVVEQVGPRGGIQSVPIAKLWLGSSKRISVHDTAYMPALGSEKNFSTECGASLLNTFHFPQHEELPMAAQPPKSFIEHFEYVFGEDVETAYDYFAHIVQRPEERPSWVPLSIASAHGTGRGWVDLMMLRVLGHWNCSATKIGPLVKASNGGFSNFYDDKLWCNIPEIKVDSGTRYEVDDKLRDVLTDKNMLINPKYGRQSYKPIFTRTFLCSNHTDGLIIPPEDRRIWATRVSGPPKPTRAYDALYDELKNDHYVARIFHFFKHRDLSNFNACSRAPETRVKQEIIALSRSEPEDAILFLNSLIAEPFQEEWKPEVVTTEQAYAFIGARSSDDKRRLRAALKDKKNLYHPGGNGDGRVKWRGKPEKVWILGDVHKWRNASTDRVRDELERVQQVWDKAAEAPFEDGDEGSL